MPPPRLDPGRRYRSPAEIATGSIFGPGASGARTARRLRLQGGSTESRRLEAEMDVPRIGVSLPHFGPYVGPDAVVTVARAAERFGFHGVSVSERLLMPIRPDWS